MNRPEFKQDNQGAVLVVSLIMLAVVTFIVIAYLAFAQRERTSINMSVIQTETRFLLDTGTAKAQALVAQKIIANENYQLLVSVNEDGENQMLPYDTAAVKNLRKDARVPVYYDHDHDDKPDEFRYWLDLNRDGVFQPTGLSTVGDPHWIGVLEDPALPHGPENRFVGRYAYMIVPASKTLDLNHIHNWAKNTEGEGFLRLGGWTTHELNLAGTLGALRSLDPANNQGWLYELYNPALDETSRGTAFQDAASLFQYRKMAGEFYDLFDLYTPVRAGPRKVPDGVSYAGLTQRLERSGAYALYDLAGAVSTHTQPIPEGKFNLNDYLSLVVDIERIETGADLLICKAPHHFPPGARLCLYSDTGVSPLIQRADGNGTRLIEAHDVFFAEPLSDEPRALKLYHAYSTDTEDFSKPVDFVSAFESDSWLAKYRYAQNDVVRALVSDGENSQAVILLAKDDHVSKSNLANDLNLHWTIINELPETEYVLDRSLEMFEEVAARLLKARARGDKEISSNVANLGSDGSRPLFNIRVSPLSVKSDDELEIMLGEFGMGDPPDEGLDREYTPEIQRLLQVSANVVDTFTPGPIPSVFRPVYARGEDDSIIIRHFTKEPNRSFLAQRPAWRLPVDLEKVSHPLDRISHLDYAAKAWALPLYIGSKNRWPGGFDTLHAVPSLNEISVQCIMEADASRQALQPLVRVNFEIKDRSGGSQLPVQLHVTAGASGKIESIKSAQWNENYLFQSKTNIHQWVTPGQNGLAVANYLAMPLLSGDYDPFVAELTGNRETIDFREEFERRPWFVKGSIFLNCVLATPDTAEGKKGKIVDHSDLELDMSVLQTFYEWPLENHEYQKFEEVLYMGDRYFYNSNVPSIPSISNDVKEVVTKTDADGNAVETRKILDPEKWTMLNWTWNQARNSHPNLYPAGSVIKKLALNTEGQQVAVLYTAKQDFPPSGSLAADARLGLVEFYGGELCEWSWQANDPQLNGQEMDFRDYYNAEPGANPRPEDGMDYIRLHNTRFPPGPAPLGPNIGLENLNWQPWRESFDPPENHAHKDPGVQNNGNWDFPVAGVGAPLRSVGDLGRIHRGTPWQTIYLKAAVANEDLWREWSVTRAQEGALDGSGTYGVLRGSALNSMDLGEKSLQMHPTNDWPLLEAFSVSPGDDSMRGLLSVNQASHAAWAAALSGVRVLPDGSLHAAPGDGKMRQIVSGINSHRQSKRGKFPYSRVTEILEVPELTSASPYLPANGATEWHYEAIPRQILSLLRVEETPYFIAYVYSQALRPAPGAILRKKPNKGLCINYQVVGEAAARTVFRLEGAQAWADYHEAKFSGLSVGGAGGLGGLLGGLLGGGGGAGGLGGLGGAGGLGGLLGGAGGAGGLGGLLGGAGGAGGLAGLGGAGGLAGLLGGAGGLGGAGALAKPPAPRVVIESYAPMFVR